MKLSNTKTSATPNAVDTKHNNAFLAGLKHSNIPNSFPLATTTHTAPPLTTDNEAPNEGHSHLWRPVAPNKYQLSELKCLKTKEVSEQLKILGLKMM